MPIPDDDEFGPYRAWPQTLVQPVEGRVERLRDNLRRTPVRRPKLTNKKISYTVHAYPFNSAARRAAAGPSARISAWVVGSCWLPRPSTLWKAAMGVRRRLKRKVISSR